MSRSVERILQKWGNVWAKSRIGTEYPSITPSIPFKPKPLPSNAYIVNLTDEECLKIEKAVIALHDVDLLAYQVTMAKYVQRWCKDDIIVALNLPSHIVPRLRNTGINFLKGYFSSVGVDYTYTN